MVNATSRPSPSQLNRFIAEVDDFPVSAPKLMRLARSSGAPKAVADFYGSFANDLTFKNREDLAVRSEQVEAMRSMEVEMPREELTAPEED
ncbi:MAG TPA: hypothetical protein VFW90_04435 [Candidatus Saccharimonadales bacterium]|nr:hypothetical protein [Candidatus Saccharimonadales bacterium]